MSYYLEVGSSSEDSDDDIEIGFIEPAPQRNVVGLGIQLPHVEQPASKHRILPSRVTNCHGGASVGPSGSVSSSSNSPSCSSARRPPNPSPVNHVHSGPGFKVLPSSLMAINKGKQVGPVGNGNGRSSNRVGTSTTSSVNTEVKYDKRVIEKYGEDPSTHPEFDESLWEEVVGLNRHGDHYGQVSETQLVDQVAKRVTELLMERFSCDGTLKDAFFKRLEKKMEKKLEKFEKNQKKMEKKLKKFEKKIRKQTEKKILKRAMLQMFAAHVS